MSPETDPTAPPLLDDCPDLANCVSSQASRASQRVDPFPCGESCRETLAQLKAVVDSMRGATVVVSKDTYLRAEFKTLVLGFVDDLELLADPEAQVVHVRSASRAGAWDLGLNHRRVERLRRRLQKR